MATAYNAGTAFVQLFPSLRGFAGKLRTELRAINETVAVRAEADTSTLRAEIQAAAQAAAAGVRADVEVGFDTAALRSELQAAVRAAAAGVTTTIPLDLDVDVTGLRARLTAVRGLKVSVELEPNIAALRALLAAVPPIPMRVDLQADLAALRAQLAASNLSTNVRADVDKDGSGRAAASGLAQVLKIAAAALGAFGAAGPAVLAPLISSLTAAAGAAGLIPAALAAAGGSFAAIKIGVSGVGDAFTALGAAQEQSGAAGASAAAAQEAAAKRVRDAVRGVEEAQRQADRSAITSAQAVADARDALADAQAAAAQRVTSAQQALDRAVEQSGQRVAAARERVSAAVASAARSVAAAEQTLERAQRSARTAQEDLTRARKDATEQLEDLKLSLAGAALDEEAAVLALERARERLANMPADSTSLDFREAELAVRQASQALDETRERFGDVQEASAAAGKAGVEGSDGVRDAQQRVADANQGVADAEAGLIRARTDGAAQVADAQQALAQTQIDGARDVAAAQANLTQAQTDGAAQVADAQQGVARAQQSAAWAQEDASRQVQAAQEALAEAYADSGTAASASADKAAAALAKLAPAAREYVAAVQALRPAWDALKMDVQQALFAGLGTSLTQLANAQLPGLAAGLSGIASGFNTAARELATFLSSAGAVADVKGILADSTVSTDAWAMSLVPISAMFLDIAAVGAPILGQLSTGFLDAANRAASFIDTARQSGDLARWIEGGLAALRDLGEFLGNIAGSIGAVFTAMQTAGTSLMDTLILVTGEMEKFLKSPIGQDFLVTFFQTLHGVAQALMPGLQALGTALAESFIALAPALQPIAQAISAVVTALSPLLPVVAEIASFLGTYLAEAVIALTPLLRTIAEVVGTVLMTAFDALKPVFVVLIEAMRELAPVFEEIARSVGELLVSAIEAIAPILPPLVEVFLRLFEALLPVVDVVLDFATQLVEALAPILPQIADMIVRVVDALIPLIDPLMRIAEVLLPLFVGALSNSIQGSTDFVSVLVDILVWTLENVVVPAFEILAGIIEFVAGVFSDSNTNVIQPVTAAIGGALGALGEFFRGVWENVIKPTWEALGAGIRWVYDNVLVPAWDQMQASLQAIGDFFVWIWENVIRPTWEALGSGIRFVYDTVIQPAWNTLQTGLQAVGDFFVAIWNNVIKPTWEALGMGIRWVYDNVIQPAWNALQTALQAVGDFFRFIWDTVIRPVWDALGAGIDWVWQNMIRPVFDALKIGVDLVGQAFDSAVAFIRTVWEQLRDIVAAPVRFVVDFVYNKGIVPAWNFVAGLVGLGKLSEYVLPFATGGVVPGYAPGRDQVPAILSPGEGILRPEATRAFGPQWIDQVNAVAMRGGVSGVRQFAETGGERPQQFAKGGVVAGQQWAKQQAGKPYLWGGVGPRGFDCSGIISALTNVVLGAPNPNYRRFATGSFTKSRGAGGFVPGTGGQFAIGVSTNTGKGIGHMSGNLAGLGVESRGGDGVVIGGGARSITSSMFPWQFHLPQVGGVFTPSGGEGGGGPAFDVDGTMREQFGPADRHAADARGQFGGNLWGEGVTGVFGKMLADIKQLALDKLTEYAFTLATPALVAGARVYDFLFDTVKDQVKGVARRYGWGEDPQWAAIDRLVQKESSWNVNAKNPTSSARGLFQKMTSIHGPVEADAAGQAEWGLNYIRGRYGDPVKALAFHNRHNYYDNGGTASGRGIMLKSVLQPERVLSPRQNVAFEQLVGAATAGYSGTRQGSILSPEQWSSGSASSPGPLIGSLSVSAGDNASARDIVDEAMWQARTARNSGRYTRR